MRKSVRFVSIVTVCAATVALAGCGGYGATSNNTPPPVLANTPPPASPTITAPAPPPVTDAMPFVFDLTPLVGTVGASEPLALTMSVSNGSKKVVTVDKRFPQLEYRVYDAQGKQMPGPPVVQTVVRQVACADLATLKPTESIATQNSVPIWKWKLAPGVYGIEATLTIPGVGADCDLNPFKGKIVSRRAAFTVK